MASIFDMLSSYQPNKCRTWPTVKQNINSMITNIHCLFYWKRSLIGVALLSFIINLIRRGESCVFRYFLPRLLSCSPMHFLTIKNKSFFFTDVNLSGIDIFTHNVWSCRPPCTNTRLQKLYYLLKSLLSPQQQLWTVWMSKLKSGNPPAKDVF